MGRKPKKKPLEEHIEMAMEVAEFADVMDFDELKDYPALVNEPPKNQLIMAGVAMGISQERIAKAFGVSQPAVAQIIARIDPMRKMRATKEAKKAFQQRIIESKANSLLMSVKEDEIDELPVDKRITSAVRLHDLLDRRNQSKHKERPADNLDRLLARANAEASGAPYDDGDDGDVEDGDDG